MTFPTDPDKQPTTPAPYAPPHQPAQAAAPTPAAPAAAPGATAAPGTTAGAPTRAAAPTAPAAPIRATAPKPTTLQHFNAYALISIIMIFIQPIVGLIFGHMALSQIKRNNTEAGRGVALTSVIIGYVFLSVGIFIFMMYLSLLAMLGFGLEQLFSELSRNGYDSDYGYDFS